MYYLCIALALKDYNGEISNAKSEVGLFSTVGVAETRELFWTRFDQGKKFATRQSKWDLLFIGLSSMRRDEHVLSYMLRALMSVLMNITIGMCMFCDCIYIYVL